LSSKTLFIYIKEFILEPVHSPEESKNKKHPDTEELKNSSSICSKDICEDNDVITKVRAFNPAENDYPLGSDNKSVGEFKLNEFINYANLL